ncbi:rhomboid family intramembrane serine protease [Candidatus Epulonipiscioides saccharophilum]|nr:rhomboid family intramembrane serine protease [Epulopiscium sp. SCG-B10WGA-EpuloB]
MKFKLSFNSPIILYFTFICACALGLNTLTNGLTNQYLFSTYQSSLADPLTYFRIIAHVFGHADWNHFLGNITLILLVGPLLEEKYGSFEIFGVIIATALITGIVNNIFFPEIRLLGASGVAFSLILLSSFASIQNDGEIPLTFILIALIYIMAEVVNAITIEDNVSNITHIIGGFTGAGLGFFLRANND